MILEKHLLEWRRQFPWTTMQFVEQDILISRAIVAIYSDPFLASRLAWRGGTALYKLYVTPQPRYSEDIDLVLINPEPMGPILDRLRDVLSFVPDQQAKGKRYNHVMKLRYVSEIEEIPCRIKVEINCNEHFSELGFDKVPFSMESGWFSGSCEVTAYCFDEMLGTKFNAVYGRKRRLWRRLCRGKWQRRTCGGEGLPARGHRRRALRARVARRETIWRDSAAGGARPHSRVNGETMGLLHGHGSGG